jgi:hypothetical protein
MQMSGISVLFRSPGVPVDPAWPGSIRKRELIRDRPDCALPSASVHQRIRAGHAPSPDPGAGRGSRSNRVYTPRAPASDMPRATRLAILFFINAGNAAGR